MAYIRPDGEKPVINEIIDNSFIEMPVKRLKTYKSSQEDAPVIEKAEKPETGEKPGKKPPLDKNLKEGIRLFRMKRWEGSLHELLLVKAANFEAEEKAELAYYLGLCYTKLERYEEAVLHLEQVIASGHDVMRTYQCRLTLAYIYVITNRVKMADFELSRLQKGGFESAPLYNTLAYSAYLQKRYRNAIELYEKALDLDENNATALNSMGFILADTGIDKTRGLRLCRKAVERNPKNAAYLDSLGWAHFKCGNLTEARNWLNRAVDIAPKEKEIKEHYRIVAGGKAW
jgi:tetratricopeptide (TPR) repeat protein